MSATNTALLDLIGKTPMMRAMQIADRLDIAVDEVDTLLRHSLQEGSVIEHEVDAPNNRKAMAYELSAQYMATHALTAPPRAIVECTQQPAPVVNSGIVGREPTKVERAIAYVRKNGPSSSAQLHTELGLAEGVHISSYLGSAVRTGRMVRDGNTWFLPGPGTVAPADIPKFSNIGSATVDVGISQPAQCSAPDEQAAPSAEASIAFRCALWSDGTFEIQRNGATIASLHPSEHSTVIETLQRARAA